jgi:hypothetical protein
MEFNTRKEVVRGIRIGKERAINIYCNEIKKILSKNLLKDSYDFYYKNRYKFPEIGGPEEFENGMLYAVCRVALKNPVCMELFELEEDYSHFQKYLFGIYRYIRLGTISHWINKGKQTASYPITYNLYGEAIEHLFIYRDSHDREDEICKKEFLFGKLKSSIQKMRNANRKRVMNLWIQNSKIKTISEKLNMNMNTVSAHIRRGKIEILREIEET